MGRPLLLGPDRSPLQDDLYFEILRSERLRIGALMIVMGSLCLAALLFDLVARSTRSSATR